MESRTESPQNPLAQNPRSTVGFRDNRAAFPNSTTASTLRMPHESALPGTQTASKRLYNQGQGPARRLRLSSALILPPLSQRLVILLLSRRRRVASLRGESGSRGYSFSVVSCIFYCSCLERRPEKTTGLSGMRSNAKIFGPNLRVATGSRNKSKIMEMSRKQYSISKAYMRRDVNIVKQDKQIPSKNINIGHLSAKILNNSSMAKGASKSNHAFTSKGMKQPSSEKCSISVEKNMAHSRLTVDGKASSKGTHTLDSTLPDIHCNSRSTSSYPLGRDPIKSQRDNHSMNLTFENAEKREPIERNMGQYTNCNGKNNNSMSKKRKEPLYVENPKELENDSNVEVHVDSMSCRQMKKLRKSKVIKEDEAEDGAGDHHLGLEDDTASILKNVHAKVSASSCVEQQCYSCSKPIDKPTWSGIFKTDDKEYVSLDGHLATKSCEKAWSLSKQLLKVVEVKKLSRLEVWPKAWEVSKPIADDIGIYFFPHEMRQDEGLDRLVREVKQNDLALQAIIGEAEMMIFPSILLPNHHQRFQGKHYLWGVFKRREEKSVVAEEPLSVVGRCELEKQQNVVSNQPNHMLPNEQPNQEMIQMASIIPLERHMLPPNKSTQYVEASRLKGPTDKVFDLKAPGEEGEATPVATDAVAILASHGQTNPSVGRTPGRLMGFVVQKTPKLDLILREMEQEGALAFALQGEMVGVGSWTGSKAPATQK